MKKNKNNHYIKYSISLGLGFVTIYMITIVLICNKLITLHLKPINQVQIKQQLQQQLPPNIIIEAVTFNNKATAGKIAAWWLPQPTTNRGVILVHGHNDSKADNRVVQAATLFSQLGLSVLMIDLQNHGKSTRLTNQTSLGSSEYTDVLAAQQFMIKQGYDATQLIYWGMSLGGSVCAVAAQHEPRIKTLIVDSSFADVDQIIQYEFKRKGIPLFFYWGAKQVATKWYKNPIGSKNPLNLDQTALTNLLILHSEADQRVLVDHALQFYAKTLQHHIKSTLYLFKQSKHGQAIIDQTETYRKVLIDFLKGSDSST